MKKIPRGVYYLSLLRILKSSGKFYFQKNSPGIKLIEFEKLAAEELNATNIKAMPHARISLYYILKSYPLQPGDEILMSPTTLPDMVNMVLLAGLTPVFADFKEKTHVVDLEKAATLITTRTKILFLTHLYGILPDMVQIEKFCQEHSLFFIQDCTQSYGCRFNGRAIVDFADSTFFSTCSLKDLHTHMGSLLCTKSREKMDLINLQTQSDFTEIDKAYFGKFLKEDLFASLALNPLLFSTFTYYIFKFIFKINPVLIEDLIDARGIKIGPITLFKGLFGGSGDFRRKSIPKEMLYYFGELQAEVGLVGLKTMKHHQDLRRKNTLLLIEKLSHEARSRIPTIEINSHDTFWRIPIYLEEPREFESFLFDHGIDPGKTTLPCLPYLEIFQDLKQFSPIAKKMGSNSIFLPNYHYLKEVEINHVANTVNLFFEKK